MRGVGVLQGRLLDGFFGQKRQHIGAFHDGGFFSVNHGQKRRHLLTLVQRHLHAMQELREHGIAGIAARVFGLKQNVIGLDIDQALGVTLEPQGLDVSVFDVFFALGGLQLGIEGHGVGFGVRGERGCLFSRGGGIGAGF